ncbi:unnamed protein product [Adineta steineri]|uniref:ADP ribosyltransferase domain-containing protein n=1 Tax=Adineta steineri TaxID=433720 RepID=A0A819NX01_9BILA|nr:unnamed protein product [Adineta steineri]CAF4004991.1 unnamed protein product [Adineta steineri]
MQADELSTLRCNEGSLIATNGYLSTTRSKEVALKFTKQNTNMGRDRISVLYEIHCNLQELKSTMTLADISVLSEFINKQEVLFDIGTTFKIMSIKENKEENLWIVRLRATDKGVILAQYYVKLHEGEGEKTNYTIVFGKLLIAMGKYDQALRYFQTLLKETQVEEDMANIYNQIGKVYRLIDKFKEAMENYQLAHDLTLNCYPIRIRQASKALNNIAIIFRKWCQYEKALQLHLQALHMKEDYYGKEHLETAKTLKNIGSIYEETQQYNYALEFYQHCLTIQQKYFPNDHIDIAASLENIGKVYYKMNYLDLALNHLRTSLTIRQKLLPPDHNDIAGSLMNIANIYADQNHFHIALEYYFKALDIQQKIFDINGEHRDIATTLRNIALVYENLLNHSSATQFYQKALDMNEKLLSTDHLTMSKLNDNITTLTKNK